MAHDLGNMQGKRTMLPEASRLTAERRERCCRTRTVPAEICVSQEIKGFDSIRITSSLRSGQGRRNGRPAKQDGRRRCALISVHSRSDALSVRRENRERSPAGTTFRSACDTQSRAQRSCNGCKSDRFHPDRPRMTEMDHNFYSELSRLPDAGPLPAQRSNVYRRPACLAGTAARFSRHALSLRPFRKPEPRRHVTRFIACRAALLFPGFSVSTCR